MNSIGLKSFKSFSVVAKRTLICSVLWTCLCSTVYAQTDEENVAVLITIINQHMTQAADTDGICLYPEVDFRGGARFCFTTSQPTLPSSWGGRVSSISVSTAYHADIYLGASFTGTSKRLLENATDLGSFKNSVASIKVTVQDVDKDGVNYSVDDCPNTPIGEVVFANGCALSQLDSDLDGVNDRDDRCADSISGYEVDANGCTIERDSDADGVSDHLDQCPETVGTPNGVGCAPSQLDSDNDGVNDAQDQCPNSIFGVPNELGCTLSQLDSDNDGVSDAVDQCSQTIGVPNGEGCAQTQLDTDNDGVSDAHDQCPDTTSSLVDQGGCAVDEVDTDSDGIPDHFDNTPTQCIDVDAFNSN